ncbi:MAG: glycoside hydrolase family 16 protein, partial [Balneolaceae bacterium]|nr:glycoside hydrolase family 16 protein [Balneolaceae bacterium]
MKLILGLILIVLLSFCGEDSASSYDYNDNDPSPSDSAGAEPGELIWADEFEGSGVPNPENWTYDIGHGSNGWGNNEVQYYTDEPQNVRIEDGKLIIEALKENGEWTSARIKTQGKQSFRYVTVKARAKLPTGSGTWPAIWMLGSDISEVGWPACG